MKRRLAIFLLLFVSMLAGTAPANGAPNSPVDLTPRLQEIYETRARLLLWGGDPSALAPDYQTGSRTADWALSHEKGKFTYMQQWSKNRGVRLVEATPRIRVQYLGGNADRARYYVAQVLTLAYVYPGEEILNRFGVGTRHVVELRRQNDRWVISLEWYTDPLGDDTEVPDVAPALVPGPLLPGQQPSSPVAQAARKGYDREGAVKYADTYCGLAWGCANDNRYNPRYRDYSGVGGDCTNFVSQALQQGGGLRVPQFTRVENLVSHLQYTGLGSITYRETFQQLWKRARNAEQGFHSLLRLGDLIAYQEKGKLEHFAIVTGFDSRGYPLINSHTADRYHVPFDLGWDRKTVYWLIRMR